MAGIQLDVLCGLVGNPMWTSGLVSDEDTGFVRGPRRLRLPPPVSGGRLPPPYLPPLVHCRMPTTDCGALHFILLHTYLF